MKTVQTFKSNIRRTNSAGVQYGPQIFESYCTGDESELPAPNTQVDNRSGGGDKDPIDIQLLETEEHDQDTSSRDFDSSFTSQELLDEKLFSDSINLEALPSGEERLKSIQQVMSMFTGQFIFSSVCAVWLLFHSQAYSIYVRLGASGFLVAMTLAFNKYGVNFKPTTALLCYGVFSASLPFALTLVACLINCVVLSHLLVQVSALSMGLCLYSWTTKYENWSRKEEVKYAVTPTIFASALMILLFAASPLAVVVTGGFSLLIGHVLSDCAKDNIVPASSLDQLLSDAVAIHFNIATRAPFLFSLKVTRLARKANWF